MKKLFNFDVIIGSVLTIFCLGYGIYSLFTNIVLDMTMGRTLSVILVVVGFVIGVFTFFDIRKSLKKEKEK